MRDGDWPDPTPINPPYDGPDGIFAGYGEYDDIREVAEQCEKDHKAEEVSGPKERVKWKDIQARFGEGQETFLDRMEIFALLREKAGG